MSDDNTNFQLVTPLRLLSSQKVILAVLPGQEGNLGVMAKHTPLLTLLKRGVVELFDENKIVDRLIVDGGVAEVTDNGITVLSERAEFLKASNKEAVEEKLLNCRKNIDSKDEGVYNLAKIEVDFYNFVLEQIN